MLYDKIDTVCLAMREDRAITAVRVPFQTDYVAFEEARRQEEAKTLALPSRIFTEDMNATCFSFLSFPGSLLRE